MRIVVEILSMVHLVCCLTSVSNVGKAGGDQADLASITRENDFL